MELKRYLGTIVRWSWLIILATALAAGISYRSSLGIPRVYQATTTLLVGHTLQTTNPNPDDIQTSQTLAKSYIQLVRSQPVLQATIDALHLNMPWFDLSPEVNGMVISGTETIEISVVDRDPQRAKTIADELARQLILQSPTPRESDPQRQFANQQMQILQGQLTDTQAQIAELQKRADQETSAVALQDLRNQINILQQKVNGWQNTYAKLSDFYQGSHTNYLSVIQPAVLPTSPVGTSTTYNVILSGGIGFALALGGIILIEFLDDTIKSEKEAAAVLSSSILGGTGWVKHLRRPSDQLFAQTEPNSLSAEAYRYLGANVRRLSPIEGQVVLITSPGPREGKSTVAANLAITLAHQEQRVILVDANLRRPSLHLLFDIPNTKGLSTVLASSTFDLADSLHSTSLPNLLVLPSGPLIINPGDLLGSPLMQACIAQMRSTADTIIIDTPAVLGAAETGVLGTLCDRVLVVVHARRTRLPAAQQVMETFRLLGVKIDGVILNNYELGRRAYRGYYAIAADAPTVGHLPQCPFLGRHLEGQSGGLAQSVDDQCHSGVQPEAIDVAHRQRYCDTANHVKCPRFARAQSGVTPQSPNPADQPTAPKRRQLRVLARR